MHYVSYPLQNGFISNWLVAGPQAIPVAPETRPTWEPDTGIRGTPVERGPLGSGEFHAGAVSGVWAYQACPEDHCVDHSGTYPRHTYLRSWAYTELVNEAPQSVAMTLTVYGPAGVWVAGAAAFQTQDASGGPATHAFRIHLENDVTPILVRFERLARGETAHAMALRVSAEGLRVRIPTLIPDL